MKPLTVGSLFAGIAGFDIAAEWMGWRTIWFSEIDPYCCEVLRERFPGVPNHGDITRIAWDSVAVPDVLCGGFPCQPHSTAGKRLAGADARDLWGECVRAVRELRPSYAVFENVTGLLTSDAGRFFNRVLSDLAALGYDAEWSVLSAADVGAPHRRERVWIVAYPNGSRGDEDPRSGELRASRLEQSSPDSWRARPAPTREGPAGGGWWEVDPADMANAHRERGCRLWQLMGRTPPPGPWWPVATADGDSGDGGDGGDGTRGPQPSLGRVADGVPARLDRLRALGNAIVPQCAVEGPFKRIQALEAERLIAQ